MSSLEVGGCDAFERSFDFSKFPNLQKVYLGVGWVGGNLLWILTALSTLRPATSPRLSTIQLKFTRPPTRTRYVETAIECTVDDLRRIADEVTRIKREFKGALSVTVLRDPKFEAVLDAFNVRFHLRGEYLIVPLIHSHPFLADLSALRSWREIRRCSHLSLSTAICGIELFGRGYPDMGISSTSCTCGDAHPVVTVISTHL